MKFFKVFKTIKQKEVFLASVILTRDELDTFNSMLSGDTYEQFAEQKNWSVKKVNRIVESLKEKYNLVQEENADILKPFE